jgi:RNA polymerase sigma-70 factor (ECF subfamily)
MKTVKKPVDPLLDYLRRPNRRRLQAVVREHYEFVWLVAYRVLGNDEDAADVSQDVFLRLLLRPPVVDTVVSPKGYLSWCVVGRASSLRRSAERRRERERASLERLSRSGLETDNLDALRAAMEALPLELRQVVELRYLAEMPTREIAEILSISERAVRLRAEKAREALKGRLAPIVSGLLVSGGALIVEAAPPPPADLLDGLLRIAQMGVPLGTEAAAQSASVGIHCMTGAFLMSTKNVCAGAILSVLLLWSIVHFLPAGKVRVAPGPPAGGSTRAVENAARLPERTAAVDGVLPVESGAQPSPSSGEDGGLQAVSLEGKITSTSGEPVAGARVMALERKAWDEALRADMPEREEGPLGVLQRTSEKARQAASRVPRVETAADGTYVFRGLDPGDYQVLAAHPEYLPRQDAWAIVEPERTGASRHHPRSRASPRRQGGRRFGRARGRSHRPGPIRGEPWGEGHGQAHCGHPREHGRQLPSRERARAHGCRGCFPHHRARAGAPGHHRDGGAAGDAGNRTASPRGRWTASSPLREAWQSPDACSRPRASRSRERR